MLVGFTGKPGSGKTYSANAMWEEYNLLDFSYAFKANRGNASHKCGLGDMIKCIAKDLFPHWHDEYIRGKLKEIVDPKVGLSPRRVQQIIGKSLLEINPTIWSDIMFEKLDSLGVEYRNNDHVLVTVDDIRFPQDFDSIKSRDGVMIGIIPSSSEYTINDEDMKYDTEKHFDELISKCDYTFVNNYDGNHKESIKKLANTFWEGGR